MTQFRLSLTRDEHKMGRFMTMVGHHKWSPKAHRRVKNLLAGVHYCRSDGGFGCDKKDFLYVLGWSYDEIVT